MPSSRQYRTLTLLALLAVSILYYLSFGASNTHASPFYTRTKAALDRKKSAHERAHIVAEEREHAERVEKLRKEHEGAVAGSAGGAPDLTTSESKEQAAEPAYTEVVVGGEKRVKGQKPMGMRTEMGGGGAGSGKKVEGVPEKDPGHDGVAKIGNIRKPNNAAAAAKDGGEEEEDAELARRKKEEEAVELELNDILRKGPIIIFSKSYCPYSKKAKHILLDLYTIKPEPYVVELDLHDLGRGLQKHLEKSTGRRTVPNVLINGKSIGGGDDVEGLHQSGKLAETLRVMGGKRVEVEKKTE